MNASFNSYQFLNQQLLLNERVWNMLRKRIRYFVNKMLKANKNLSYDKTNFKQSSNTDYKYIQV